MEFLRVIKDSDDLKNIIDIPKGLRNRKVEIIILPYEDTEKEMKRRSLRGALSEYKDKTLQSKEDEAWSKAMGEKHENS